MTLEMEEDAAQKALLVHEKEGTATLDGLLAEIGFNGYQWRLFLLCGTGYVADSMWFSALSALLPQIQAEFGIDWALAGLGSTCTVIGMIIGALGFGVYASIYGRKLSFQITLAISTVSGILAAFSPTFPLLCLALGLLGIGIGGNIPVDAAFFLESIPPSHRSLLTGLTVFWSASNVLTTLLSWILIPPFSCSKNDAVCDPYTNRGWRYLLLSLGGISVLTLSARLLFKKLHESPRFLLSQGRTVEAANVLRSLAAEAGKTLEFNDEDLSLGDDEHAHIKTTSDHPSSFGQRLGRLFSGKETLRTTLLLWYVWITVSLAYGIFGSFIVVFLSSGHSSSSENTHSLSDTYRDYLIVTTAGVPGTLLATYLVDSWLGRRWLMALSTLGSAGSLYLFTLLPSSTGHLVASIIAQFLGNIMWGVLYAYSTEVYPTDIRTFGFGVASALGRVGGALAPLLAGVLIKESTGLALHVSAGVLATSAIGMALLPIETRSVVSR